MAKRPSGQSVRSAERMLDLLASFTAEEPVLSTAALSRRTGLAPTTVRRLLQALESHGFVRAEPGGFRPSHEVTRLAGVVWAGDTLFGRARLTVERLAESTGETVELQVPTGDRTVVVHVVESTRLLRVSPHVGLVRDVAWAGAAGIALRAWSEPVRSGAGDPGVSGELGEFAAAWRSARQRGYAVDNQRSDRGIWSVAAPVRDPGGEIVGALQLSMPATRGRQGDDAALGGQILSAAEFVAADIAFPDPQGEPAGPPVG